MQSSQRSNLQTTLLDGLCVSKSDVSFVLDLALGKMAGILCFSELTPNE